VKVSCCSLLEFVDREVFSDDGGRNRGGGIDFEGRKNLDTLVFADFRVCIAIDCSDSEDTIVLMNPLIELFGKGL
jgi:hypothetical protein